MKCPCHSGKNYAECCEPYHRKKRSAEDAAVLMRSRYSAYALGLSEYIMQTTHPFHPDFHLPREEWRRQIMEFCRRTTFEGLRIEKVKLGPERATVRFRAKLLQGDQDVSFTEESLFEKVGLNWLYRSGQPFYTQADL